MAPTTRARAKQLQGSFPEFSKMPKEVRLMIWKEAMPDYGIYQTMFEYEDEQGFIPPREYAIRLPAQPPNGSITISLVLPPKEARTPAFSARIFTIQALLNTCRESRSEVQFRFPHSVPSPGGELRFDGARDIISVTGICCDLEWLENKFQSGTVVFAEGWNMLPRRLSISSEPLGPILEYLFTYTALGINAMGFPPLGASRLYSEVRTFQDLLSSFTNLKQLFWTNLQHISVDAWNNTSQGERKVVAQVLGKCYPSSERSDRMISPKLIRPRLLTRSATNIVRLLQGDPEAQENERLKGKVQLNLPQLQSVEVFPMISVDPELECLCKAIPFEYSTRSEMKFGEKL
ncbi:hypothetical protein N0V82_008672 [Gnomoniopsis sp. IMI 355080]|nr:hypothetical protein N0V82_008672 [Gnomoniopsis sp. IMI 355080]